MASICLVLNMLTHWGWDKMADISQTTFWNAFSWMKMCKFGLGFLWILLPRVQLTIYQDWFRKWLGADQATSHYLDQWWLDYRCIYASLSLNEVTHWDRDEMDNISQITFSNLFFLMKISIRIPLKFVPKGPINNIPALVQRRAWHFPGNN